VAVAISFLNIIASARSPICELFISIDTGKIVLKNVLINDGFA
jgi:hypothetical protein